MNMRYNIPILLLLSFNTLLSPIVFAQDQIGLVATYETSATCNSVFVDGNYAYIGNGTNVEILDVSDPNNPSSIGNVNTNGLVNSIFVNGTFAYAASEVAGLTIIDISDPANASIAGIYATGDDAYNIYATNTHAFLAVDLGLQIIDISDPGNLQLTGSIALHPSAESVLVDGNIAYVGVLWAGIEVYDISDLASPVLLGSSLSTDNGWCTDIKNG